MSAGSCQQRQIVTTKTIICGVVGQQSEEEVQKLGCVLFFLAATQAPLWTGQGFYIELRTRDFCFASPPRPALYEE